MRVATSKHFLENRCDGVPEHNQLANYKVVKSANLALAHVSTFLQ
jgi:hypothetical protein